MKHKAEKLFAKICNARNGCINLIMKAFEDVAVDFAWKILKAFKCGAGTTKDELQLSFDDYSKGRPVRQYPHYKTQVEIVRESMEKYMSKYPIKRYYKCVHCDHAFLDVGPRYCPKCRTTHIMPLSETMYKNWKTKSMRDYEDKKYGYVARPGIDLDDGDPDKRTLSLREQEFYTAQDVYDHAQREKKKSKPSVSWCISSEEAEYLWGCMPKWIKEVPGPEHAWDCMWFGTLSREGDLKVHNEVKRILNR